jgi:hypothetical protein
MSGRKHGPAECWAGKISGKIIIRAGVEADREAARALCRALHGRTVFGSILFSDRKFDKAAAQVLPNSGGNSVALAAELNDKLVGLTWASAGEYFIGEGVMLTTVHMIAVDTETLSPFRRAKTFLRLIEGVRRWAVARNAGTVLVHVTAGVGLSVTDRLLRTAGASRIGGSYLIFRTVN